MKLSHGRDLYLVGRREMRRRCGYIAPVVTSAATYGVGRAKAKGSIRNEVLVGSEVATVRRLVVTCDLKTWNIDAAIGRFDNCLDQDMAEELISSLNAPRWGLTNT